MRNRSKDFINLGLKLESGLKLSGLSHALWEAFALCTNVSCPNTLSRRKKFDPKITSMLAKYARKENATDKILRNHLEVKWCLLKCISGCKFLEKLLAVKNSCKAQ